MAESNVLQRIRIGLVGAGAFGRVHLATIRHLAEAVLTAVVDRDDAKLRDLPNGVSVWTDLESALAANAADCLDRCMYHRAAHTDHGTTAAGRRHRAA